MRPLLAVLATLFVLLVTASSAAACSCVGGDPRDRLSGARAAFVGTVTEERESGTRRSYRLTVEKSYKGDLPATVEVASDARSTCGIDLAVGERVGLLLRGTAPPYEVGICDAIEPEELEAATQPYPRGSGVGTARLLVAGTFHDAGLAALDGRGRLIGWAFGSEGDTVDVCPGARYALQAGDDVSVIRLRDLAVVDRRKLPGEATRAVRCLSRSGDRLAALTFDYGGGSDRQRLLTMRGRRVRQLGVRASVSAALGTSAAYLAMTRPGSYRLVSVDYSTRRSGTLVSGRGWVDSLALSPDGRRLAFVSAPPRRRPYRLGLLSTADPSNVRTRRLGRSHGPLWLSNRRLAVPDHQRAGDSFDTRLRRRGAVASWSTDSAVAIGGRVWWLEYATGLRGRALTPRTSSLMTIDYLGGARGLAAIPAGARIVADRRAPSAESAAAVGASKRCGGRASQ